MKKKIWIPIACTVILLAVLFVPIPYSPYKDGGTREYRALTYRIVDWNRLTEDGVYDKTCVYFGSDCFRSIDELWAIEAVNIKSARDLRHMKYTGEWLDRATAEKHEGFQYGGFVIDTVYADCFFVKTDSPEYAEYKINGELSEEWCVGDKVTVTYDNRYFDGKDRWECDLMSIRSTSDDEDVLLKPVIYLYPENETEVSVKLQLDGVFTCTYPQYRDGWYVTASPDGTLTDENGQTYNYLYWEGEGNVSWNFDRGFCVKGEDTAEFLEEALSKLGLNRREANEFIVFWLPKMQENEYNIISFQSELYTNSARLSVTPTPDALIRVFMAYRAQDTYAEIPPQELTCAERTGFTVVEWGGTEVK